MVIEIIQNFEKNQNVWPLKSRVSSVIVCPGCQKNRENWSSLIGVKTADRSQDAETEKENTVS